eukprot:g7120.t1
MSHPRLHQRPRGPSTALHDAANFGSAMGTVALLSSGSIDIDQGDPKGFTPLMSAAFAGHSSVVRILLSRGANVFLQEDQGATALFCAVQQGHLDATKLLVKAGSDLNARNNVDQTPLFKAAVKGYTEVSRVLIEAGASINNRGPYGVTPLWAAAHGGHKDVVAMLLHAKADPLLAADENEKIVPLPLDAAAQHGHVATVLELIQHVGIEGCRGNNIVTNALCLAAESGHVDVMAALMDAGMADSGLALCRAAEFGREGSVKFLLQEEERKGWESTQGGYLHAVGRAFGRTPLSCGVDGCSPRVVRRLLDAGVDANTGVHASVNVGTCADTILDYTVDFISELTAGGEDANEDRLHKLEEIRRMLLQAEAVHAASWLWLRDGASYWADGVERTRQIETTSAAGGPLELTLPILRRRAGRRGVLVAALRRYSAKSPVEPVTTVEGKKGACCHRHSAAAP